MKTLLLEKMGMNNNDGVLNNYRCRALVIARDGHRCIVDIGSYCRYVIRTTSKTTGKQLKNPVKEIVNANALHLDISFYSFEAWRNGVIYDNCTGAAPEMIKEFNNYSYTIPDILAAFEALTGVKYDNIETTSSRLEKPESWEKIEQQEKQEAKENYIEEEARRLSELVPLSMRKPAIWEVFKKNHFEALENYSGITASEKAAIQRAIKKTGGFRENNIISSGAALMVKLGRDDLFRVYNLVPDMTGTLHYFEITSAGRITC